MGRAAAQVCRRLPSCALFLFFFFFNDTATTEIYTLSLHDALPIYLRFHRPAQGGRGQPRRPGLDRKSTRLNSSHTVISYAVFCLKKKKKNARDNQIFGAQSRLCTVYAVVLTS